MQFSPVFLFSFSFFIFPLILHFFHPAAAPIVFCKIYIPEKLFQFRSTVYFKRFHYLNHCGVTAHFGTRYYTVKSIGFGDLKQNKTLKQISETVPWTPNLKSVNSTFRTLNNSTWNFIYFNPSILNTYCNC